VIKTRCTWDRGPWRSKQARITYNKEDAKNRNY